MFEALSALPADPILGLSTAFAADQRSEKVDLGVGVYKDVDGRTPIMAAIKEAEGRWNASEVTKSYLPPAGLPGFLSAMEKQVLGAGHVSLARSRTVQAPGGCGALRLAAEFIAAAKPGATVWMSDPTWANHIPLVKAAGLTVRTYAYFSSATHGVDFDAMHAALSQVPAGDVVLLHASCHNPTGADLTQDQWRAVADLAESRGWLPFVDQAYQGLGDGLEEDAWGLRHLAERVPEMLIANSCSKNYGLYRERVGSLTAVMSSPESAEIAKSHLCSLARGMYSMPPSHGAALVATIDADPALSASWKAELDSMRQRMCALRDAFVAACEASSLGDGFSYVAHQKGMFSYLGVSPEQVDALRDEFGVYLLRSGRINVAGISEQNIPYLVTALTAVTQGR